MDAVLVFPHQLFPQHPALREKRDVYLVEDPLFFGPDRRWPAKMHPQKILLHRASMRCFADRLKTSGHRVTILPCPEADAHTADLLQAGLSREVRHLILADPVDDLVNRRLARFSERRGISCQILDTPQFLTPQALREECFRGTGKPLMARFYERQRARMKILLTKDGKPVGGQWSFDTENRQRLPKGMPVPPPPRPEESGGLLYPSTPEGAERWLDEFLAYRLNGFGAYEDAISQRHSVLFHSVLTPSLNIGLLTPEQILRKTLGHAGAHKTPLNSLEGFVRQIIGWREFLRAAYEHRGRALRCSNFWGFSRRLPRALYEGTTGIDPVDHVIRKVLATGYCHHIERLMILGNFFLLCRIHPDDVYRWFMEMFVDSYDWVMVPNVYGMSQFADGGAFTTKPYVSGSNYVLKMSDFARGPWCAVWDALFWTFVADHREVFLANPRMSMMARLCDRLGDKLTVHRRTADRFLATIF